MSAALLWRIPEKVLFLVALLGGAFGTTYGMYEFRHKTKHIAFQVSAPIGAVLSLIVMALASAKLLKLF